MDGTLHGAERNLPFDQTANSPDNNHQGSKLTYQDAFALLIGLQIGSGVFSSSSQVDRNTAAPGFALVIWLLCGLLAWAGATCYAELGVTLPVNGGMQEYLKYIYGNGLASMASWTWIMAAKPCSMAVLSIIFAQYWVNVAFEANVAANGWQTKILALTGFYVVAGLNLIGIDTTAGLMRFFLIVKLSTLLLLLILAGLHLFFGLRGGDDAPSTDWFQQDWFGASNPDWRPGLWNTLGRNTIAVYAGLWAFGGWDNANMIAGDMRDPRRDLPRALHTAQPVVITGFLLANVCYYLVVPWADIDNTDTIAVTVGEEVCGRLGGFAFAVLVSLACLGSINVNVFTTGRLVVSAAHADWLPHALGDYGSIFSLKNDRSTQPSPSPATSIVPKQTQTPVRAILFTAILTTVYIVLGDFGSLITFIGLAEYAFFCATVLGLLVLRYKEPLLPRPYRASIVVPVIFTCTSFLLVLFGSVEAPAQAISLMTLIAIGFLREYVAQRSVWNCVLRLTGWGRHGRRYEAVPGTDQEHPLGLTRS